MGHDSSRVPVMGHDSSRVPVMGHDSSRVPRPRTHGIRVIMHAFASFVDARAMMPMTTTTTTRTVRGAIDGRRPRATTTTTRAMKPTGVTRSDLESNEKKRTVVDVDGVGAVLLQEFMGDVYAVSNACPHMGLSMQGKTPLLSAEVGGDCEITCPAHGSTFSMKDGTPRGEWCPKLPELPMVGKPFAGEPKGIATYVVSVDETSGEIMVDA